MTDHTKAAPSAQQAAGSIDTGELRRLAEAAAPGPWERGSYGGVFRADGEGAYVVASGSLNGTWCRNHSPDEAWIAAANPSAILRLLDALAAATPAQPIAPQKPMSTDEAREFLIGFMNEHFTDRTFHRYIRAERGGVNLAGDFAWQMATALRNIGAAPCAMCNGAGSVGHAPDGYFDCPECTLPVAQPIAVSAPTDEDELLALVPEREIMKLWGMCAYWGPVDTRVVPFARAVIRSALAARAAAPVSGQSASAWEWAPGLKLADDEVIHYSQIYQTAEGLPVMTDSSQHSTWNVAPVFKRAADGVDSRNPVRILTVEPSAHIDSRPRSEDSREFTDALRKAFITLEGVGNIGRNIVLKFNQRADAYTVHDYLLKVSALASTTPQKAENE